jgi:hypothetical protein
VTAPAREDLISPELSHGRDVVRVADTKAAMLLALTGGGMALASTVAGSRPPTVVAVPVVAALGLLAAAVWLLLSVARPRLDGHFGVVAFEDASGVDDVLDAVDVDPVRQSAAELLWLSREAGRRHRLLQWAVDCLRAALLLAVVAGLAAIVGVIW